MKYKNYIGVDISKGTLDFAFITEKEHVVVLQLQIANTIDSLKKLRWEARRHHIVLNKSSFVVMEHTGIYSRHLINFLITQKCNICIESGLQIKKSFGIQRGKTDKIDSRRIAEYAMRNYDKLRVWKNPRDALFRLRDLLNLRQRFLRLTNALKVPLKELEPYYEKSKFRYLSKLSNEAIDGLRISYENVIHEIRNLVNSDEQIYRKAELLRSIPGLGEITALYLICYTHEFTITTNAKRLASYAGVAPFEYSSGRSVKGKPHVHPLANKHLKSLLHMAAIATIKKGAEHNAYYEKKVKEGKAKMSVLNAVRNKIIKRVAAVITRDSPYLPRTKYLRSLRVAKTRNP